MSGASCAVLCARATDTPCPTYGIVATPAAKIRLVTSMTVSWDCLTWTGGVTAMLLWPHTERGQLPYGSWKDCRASDRATSGGSHAGRRPHVGHSSPDAQRPRVGRRSHAV